MGLLLGECWEELEVGTLYVENKVLLTEVARAHFFSCVWGRF